MIGTRITSYNVCYTKLLRAVATPKLDSIVKSARETMQSTLGNELTRLTQLKAINPSVRDSELTHLHDLETELNHLMDKTQLKLDSLRFVVVTHQ